jgi:predicted amidohydrolase YtcJ
MKYAGRAWVLLTIVVASCASTEPHSRAELVILDAHVATMNPAQPEAQAIAVRDGKVAYVGDDEHAQSWIGQDTQVLKLKGESVLPGLVDGHIHLMDGSLLLDLCSLDDARLTVAQVTPIVRDCSTRSPGKDLLVVRGLNTADFHADRAQIDALLPDRPLILYSADGHTAWVNGAALRLAHIDRGTPDPAGGHIERDRNGEPTGFLVDSAAGLVSDLVGKPTPEKRQQVLLRGLHDITAAGITTIMEANTSAETVRTYVEIARQGKLHTRVTMALGSEGEATDAEFARLKELRSLAESQPGLRADIIKLFNDGVMEYPTQTAAMLEPYLDANGKPTSKFGPLYHEIGPLTAFVRRADAEGFGIHIHAIGDRAARVGLDAFADARAHGSKRSYSMAHLELVDPKDIPRFRELGVIACLQLFWAYPDNYSVDAVLPYIGAERQSRLYPARSFIAAGATVAGGSDWDVSTYNPFDAIAVAMSRTNPTGAKPGVLGAGEKLTLREMLAAYTINAARMLNRDSEIGSLEVGKAGDLVVLDRHLDDTSAVEDVRRTKVVYTFTDGALRIGPGAP